ncbi:MAG: hypothetical protein NC078_07895 [Ruminococcus sp.]|nr:hypothetical protein [Ruminococcus sp.]
MTQTAKNFFVLAANEAASQTSGRSAGAAVGMAVLAMVLIYAVTANLQKIAAAVDKILGRKPDDSAASGVEPIPERVEGYKVKDIYEGELNLNDDNINENSEDQENG